MKWREYWCMRCNKQTAYAKGGIVGKPEVLYMGCDECGAFWVEHLVISPQPQDTMEICHTASNSRVTQGAVAHIAEAATS